MKFYFDYIIESLS